jgi:predicted transcriptional regulator
MDKKPTKDKTTVYIPPAIREKLKTVAKQHQRSFNSELVWALQQYLERQEKEGK